MVLPELSSVEEGESGTVNMEGSGYREHPSGLFSFEDFRLKSLWLAQTLSANISSGDIEPMGWSFTLQNHYKLPRSKPKYQGDEDYQIVVSCLRLYRDWGRMSNVRNIPPRSGGNLALFRKETNTNAFLLLRRALILTRTQINAISSAEYTAKKLLALAHDVEPDKWEEDYFFLVNDGPLGSLGHMMCALRGHLLRGELPRRFKALGGNADAYKKMSISTTIEQYGGMRCLQNGIPTHMAEQLLKGMKTDLKPEAGTLDMSPIKGMKRPRYATNNHTLQRCGLMEYVDGRRGLRRLRTNLFGFALLRHWAETRPKFKPFYDAYYSEKVERELKVKAMMRATE
jgi:hypothetical protein